MKNFRDYVQFLPSPRPPFPRIKTNSLIGLTISYLLNSTIGEVSDVLGTFKTFYVILAAMCDALISG